MTSSTIVAVFVDTNIFVYWRDANEPSKRAIASDWVALLWKDRTGRTSCQVLSEYYVTVTRKLRPHLGAAEAWADISELMAWQPQDTNGKLIRGARELEVRYGLSWWDCLIVAAAQLQNCSILLTEDLQDGAVLGGVTVRNPFRRELNQMISEYEASMTSTHSHPRRGRPLRKQPA